MPRHYPTLSATDQVALLAPVPLLQILNSFVSSRCDAFLPTLSVETSAEECSPKAAIIPTGLASDCRHQRRAGPRVNEVHVLRI
jgi:hypothetical protein